MADQGHQPHQEASKPNYHHRQTDALVPLEAITAREKVQGDFQGRRFKEMSKGEGSRRCPRDKV